MNQIEKEFFQLLDMGMDVLEPVLKEISAGDMDFTPPGNNDSLGELCRKMGDVAHAYASSFSSGSLDFSLSAPGRDKPANGSQLSVWLRELEGTIKDAVKGFSDHQLSSQTITREGGWKIPLLTQFHVYREALLIFFGKLDVYLRILGKNRPEHWVGWVG